MLIVPKHVVVTMKRPAHILADVASVKMVGLGRCALSLLVHPISMDLGAPKCVPAIRKILKGKNIETVFNF